jgi:hypothetical protein
MALSFVLASAIDVNALIAAARMNNTLFINGVDYKFLIIFAAAYEMAAYHIGTFIARVGNTRDFFACTSNDPAFASGCCLVFTQS